jgi:hypothetical protein
MVQSFKVGYIDIGYFLQKCYLNTYAEQGRHLPVTDIWQVFSEEPEPEQCKHNREQVESEKGTGNSNDALSSQLSLLQLHSPLIVVHRLIRLFYCLLHVTLLMETGKNNLKLN